MATRSLISRVMSWRGALSPWLRRRRAVVRGLSNEALAGWLDEPARMRAHLVDPTSFDLRLAIEELERRGVEARPSPEALFNLLTSGDDRQCLRGMLLFHAAYPACGGAPASECWSSEDPPEAWRARLARIPRRGRE
jgi:hypothetical protein